MQNWQQHFEMNPEVRSGKPCFKGTRITVADVLSYLASGMSISEILTDFPQLNHDKILAALSFAAHRENIIQMTV